MSLCISRNYIQINISIFSSELPPWKGKWFLNHHLIREAQLYCLLPLLLLLWGVQECYFCDISPNIFLSLAFYNCCCTCSDVLAWLWPGFSWPWLHFFQARAKVHGFDLASAWLGSSHGLWSKAWLGLGSGHGLHSEK